ncbi:uncharacterized protein LOC144142816 isoform X1 [Haemaphysalis longicornis]
MENFIRLLGKDCTMMCTLLEVCCETAVACVTTIVNKSTKEVVQGQFLIPRGGDLAWWQLRRTSRPLPWPPTGQSPPRPTTRPRCDSNNLWGRWGHTGVGAWPGARRGSLQSPPAAAPSAALGGLGGPLPDAVSPSSSASCARRMSTLRTTFTCSVWTRTACVLSCVSRSTWRRFAAAPKPSKMTRANHITSSGFQLL